MKRPLFSFAIAALLLGQTIATAQTGDLSDLTQINDWNAIANGVWATTVGNAKLTRYTDLAGAPPRLDRINNHFEQTDFPAQFKNRPIRFHVTNDHKTLVRIPLADDEKIYGYGLQFDKTNRNGQILDLKVDHFNTGGGATHAPVPFYISSKGYGVFFNTARFLKIYNNVGNRKDSTNNPPTVDRNPPPDEPQPGPWQAMPKGDAVEAYLHGDGMELVIFAGKNAQDIVARYNLYCGGGALPPLWGLGFWHRVPSKFSAEQTDQEIGEFDEHKIPLDVIGLEPGWQTKSYPCTFEWQKKRFPDPAAFTKKLLERGIRLNLWENPYVSPKAKIYPSLYPLSGSHTVWLGIVPDYNLPAARKILTDQHRRDHVDIGISGYKIDEVDGYDRWLWPDHATFPSGTSAETMRQTYGLLMQKMIYQDLYRKQNVRTYGLVRASNGGAAAYPFVIYSDSYGHGQYITGLSSASLSGILWCPEIRSAKNSREWLNRMHTVCFSPLAMLNAWASGQKPWSFPDVTEEVRETIQLRMRLLPYLYSAFADYHFKGIPPVRAMLLETANSDEEVFPEDQFMFGESILVAPFYEDKATARSVKLPRGNWYDFYSGRLVGNNSTIEITANSSKNRVPLFVKDGAVIPMLTKSVDNAKQALDHPLEIRHYGTKTGTFRLYEDDATTFDYEQNKFRIRKLEMGTDGDLTETIIGTGSTLFGKVEASKQMTD